MRRLNQTWNQRQYIRRDQSAYLYRIGKTLRVSAHGGGFYLEAETTFSITRKPAMPRSTTLGERVDVKVVKEEDEFSAGSDSDSITALLYRGPSKSLMARQQQSIAGVSMPLNQPSSKVSTISSPVAESGGSRAASSRPKVSVAGMATPYNSPPLSPRRDSVYGINTPSAIGSHYMHDVRDGLSLARPPTRGWNIPLAPRALPRDYRPIKNV